MNKTYYLYAGIQDYITINTGIDLSGSSVKFYFSKYYNESRQELSSQITDEADGIVRVTSASDSVSKQKHGVYKYTLYKEEDSELTEVLAEGELVYMATV